MTIKVLKIFVALDLFVILFCFIFFDLSYIINTQVAFISSAFVTLGSYLGYKKNIASRVKNHINYDDNYDEVDKMDDPYDLYSPDIEQQEELSAQEIKQIIKENKPKGNNIKNFIGGFTGMASVYRVVGYLLLLIGFFYLNNNHLLNPIPYLLGFLIVPLGALTLNFIEKGKN